MSSCRRFLPPLTAVLVLIGVASWLATRPGPATEASEKPQRGQARRLLAGLPLYFIENQGQADARVQYYVQGRDTAVYLCNEGVVVALSEPRKEQDRIRPAAFERGGELEQRRRWALKLEFLGARPVRPEGVERTPAVVSYFKGRPEEWKTGLPTYASVVYRDLWPGIDLVYEGSQGRLKSNFIVHPGADVGQIELVWRGPTGVRVNEDGALKLETPVGALSEEAPYAYQEIDGRRVEVASGYELAERRRVALRLSRGALRPEPAAGSRPVDVRLRRLHRRSRGRQHLGPCGGRSGQRVRDRGHLLHRGKVPGDRGARPQLQREQ